MGYFETSLRIVSSFFVLLVLTRIMGKNAISQLNVFTFITAITIGNIAASVSTEKDLEIGEGLYALLGWAVLTIVMGYLSLKSKTVRRIIVGTPTVIIRKGKIMEKTLKKVHLDSDTLQGMLRQQNVFSLADVEYAIMEIDGSITIMKKQDKKPGLGYISEKVLLFPTSTGVISEGKINEDALSDLNLEVRWLHEQVKKVGVKDVSDVFYAEVQTDGTLYLDYKADNLE
ncbi:DUF421 domain-containing protein [Bacillus sp. 165]|uniref:YetF domain-containing protein n=1 Tax=Bacillus sp. 165 TaxID=1529117 RepID=UPI001ADAC838|nr:DUF421 domain-containing protein [Bacillus sp. 165]MBO9129429.1 DUF421 domain-containing protein [Bacillus sp. 165]